MTDRVGQHIDDYRLLRLLGAGAFGEVYQFNDQQKQALAKQLVNKSRAAAQRLLKDSRGIAKASVDIANGGVATSF